MVGSGAGILRTRSVAAKGERKDVKMRRNCEGKSGFGY